MLDQEITSTWRISIVEWYKQFPAKKTLKIGPYSPSSTQSQLGTNTKDPLEVASILDTCQGNYFDQIENYGPPLD